MTPELPDPYIPPPPAGPAFGTARPPGSKSYANRVLPLAALAAGRSWLAGLLDCEDTRVMLDSLARLGFRHEFQVDPAANEAAGVHAASLSGWLDGAGGHIPAAAAELFVGNSGTSMRFLTALCAVGQGSYRLDGVPRMRQRPIADLLAALAALGIAAESENADGCPPVRIRAAGLPGGSATVRGDVSSQFLSGLLLAAPAARGPLAFAVDGPLVSAPYVAMTVRNLGDFGAMVEAVGLDPPASGGCRLRVVPGPLRPVRLTLEADASAASYFFAAAAVTGGRVRIEGLGRGCLQPDLQFVRLLERMGCRLAQDDHSTEVVGGPLRGIEADMAECSDVAPTLAAVASLAEGPTVIRGVAHMRHKECDRVAAMACELRRLGAEVVEFPDGLAIQPRPLRPARVETYRDHRMAMSLAVVAARVPGVAIADPGCVAKTYPGFFADFARLFAASA